MNRKVQMSRAIHDNLAHAIYKSSHRPSTFSLEIAERGGFIRYGWVGFGVLKLTCDQAVRLPRKRKKPDRRLM